VRLALGADLRLYAADPKQNQAVVFDLNGALVQTLGGLDDPSAVALAEDGSALYISNRGSGANDGKVAVFDTTGFVRTDVPVAAGAHPSALAAAATTAGDNIALIDQTRVRVIGLRPTATNPVALGEVVTDHAPVALELTAGGGFALVLERGADGKAYVQALNIHKLELGDPDALGPPLAIGVDPQALAFDRASARLYAATSGLAPARHLSAHARRLSGLRRRQLRCAGHSDRLSAWPDDHRCAAGQSH
jgi:hypothetical protein